MDLLTKRKSNLFFIGITEIFECFCRYGVKIFLIFYLTESLQITHDIASKYMHVFAILIVLLMLPSGIVTDFIFKQEKAVMFGFAIAASGCFLLIIDSIIFFFISIVLISLGLGFIKPNLYILTGRLFQKNEVRRDIGFLFFYFTVNIGGFISPFAFSSLRQFGWDFYFIISGLIMLVGMATFFFVSKSFDLREKDWYKNERNLKPQHVHYNRILLLIIFFIIAQLLFASSVIDNIGTYFALNKPGLFKIGDWRIPKTIIMTLSVYFYLPVMIIMAIYWYFVKIPKSLKRIGLSFIFFSIGLLIIIPAYFNDNYVLPCFVGMSLFAAFGELFFVSVAISYITRISPIKYSSTIIVTYLVISHFIPSLGEFFPKGEKFLVPSLIFTFVLTGIIGISILFTKKHIHKLAYGIE